MDRLVAFGRLYLFPGKQRAGCGCSPPPMLEAVAIAGFCFPARRPRRPLLWYIVMPQHRCDRPAHFAPSIRKDRRDMRESVEKANDDFQRMSAVGELDAGSFQGLQQSV